ncbi:MAG TPA: cyclic nucleotide-binding domain-containing protein [Anaerolineales bacterium]|nr:cyclic nucleotide-binding domain-containing protein [Anaerolineales bacterium]
MNRVTIFQELNEDQINLLRPLFEPFSCEVGTVILQQGTPAESLYLVISGTVEMSYKPYDGNAMTVSLVKKGGLFGWSAVIGSEKYTSSAIAIENVEAFRVRGSELRKFCLEHPEAGTAILERLADGVAFRWRNAHEQIKSLIVQGMTQKLNAI